MNRHFSRSVWQSVAVVLLALPVCAQQAAPARDTSPQILDVQGGKIRVVTVASGLFHPWSIAFRRRRTRFSSPRSNGALRMIRERRAAAEAGVDIADAGAAQANDSLHFVAVHPKFADNQLVYVSYPKLGPKGTTLAVARGHLDGTTLGDVKEIFVADAWETSGNIAGRICSARTGCST